MFSVRIVTIQQFISGNGARDFVVDTFTVDEILDHFGVTTVPFIKLDCEGCEYDVMQALSARSLLMFRSDFVAGEIHTIDDIPEETRAFVNSFYQKEPLCSSL